MMSPENDARNVTENVEDPQNAAGDMALRSEQDVDDPTGRRGYAAQNPDGPEGAAGEHEEPTEQHDPSSADEAARGLDQRDQVDDQRA